MRRSTNGGQNMVVERRVAHIAQAWRALWGSETFYRYIPKIIDESDVPANLLSVLSDAPHKTEEFGL